jgi:Protein of unknown function (DUF1761)
MDYHIWVFFVAALVPLVIGSIWYNPKVFGTAWLKSSGLTEEQAASGNMAVIFGLTYVFGLFLATMLLVVVIHQNGVMSLLASDPDFSVAGSDINNYYTDFMSQFGQMHRTFGHGAFHGSMVGLFFALPLIGVNGLFERRGFKYVAIHTGYWILTLALMGGVIAQWA